MSQSKQPKKVGGEVGEVRANIDVAQLNAYLARHVPAVKAPVSVKQFKFGQSNPTYFLTDSSNIRFVLRKKPAGKLVSKTAHQVEREFTVLNAVHKHNRLPSTSAEHQVPVPEPIVLCEDEAVIGTPFYIMEFLDGRIFTDMQMPDVPLADRTECYLSAIRALAALSSLDPLAIGLSKFGATTPYFPRQIKSLTRVTLAQAAVEDIETGKPTGEIPGWDVLLKWYSTHLPDEGKIGTRIVHGDFKLDNLVFHSTENRVIGILDWELCTLGSPLADLANLTQNWVIDRDDLKLPVEQKDSGIFRGYKNHPEDAPARLEDLEREYCRVMKLSYPIREMVFARSWMLFRGAVIMQGIAARFARRQASSERAYLYVQLFPIIGSFARKVLEEEGYSLGPEAKL
ncbi:protein kinase subdomain-containing protein PKL/CAK/ACAD [Auriscalpium vulgare]|uniref:Protein kinase subdomain-containing protein PKL/CAK/ACAD n=1 Tax=Auriscalpium vulgare TaxID=40419 RepID=A0ACB8S3W7_9AGAM|nr:protein kinase subdomain-containing protein PKL/CAK/ACAD [Auriscalpium vulgare]